MTIRLYVDGGVIGGTNPGIAIYWSVAREHEDGRIEPWVVREESDQYFTNNDAEYWAIIEALTQVVARDLLEPGVRVVIHSDSQLIVNQFNGRWKITDDRLRTHCRHAQDVAEFLILGGVEVEVLWVRRKENVQRLGH
jgi:ribonuclease HI